MCQCKLRSDTPFVSSWHPPPPQLLPLLLLPSPFPQSPIISFNPFSPSCLHLCLAGLMPWVSKGLEPAMQWSWIFAPCLIGTTLSTTQVYHPFAIHLLLHLCTVLKNANSSIYNKHLTSLHSTIQAEVHLTIPQLVRTGGAVRSLPMASLSRELLKTLQYSS